MRVIFLFFAAVAAQQYCNDSEESFGIDNGDCQMIHQEYMNMIKSGKSLEALSADLKEDEGEVEQSNDFSNADEHADDSAPDSDMSCHHSCHSCGGNCHHTCNDCMRIRRHNSYCGCRRHNSCRKSYTYGGYVHSHVIIRCYGMIDEGCRHLPTYHKGCYRQCGGCNDSCHDDSCGCGNHCQDAGHECGCRACHHNFRRYLHCVGRRVSRCYRTRITHTRQVCHSGPTEWSGCEHHWCVPCDSCTNDDCHNNCCNGGGYLQI